MSTIARSLYRVRQQATEWWGLVVVVAFAYLLALGQFSATRLWSGDLLALTGLAIYTATMVRAIMRELGVSTEQAPRRRAATNSALEIAQELELGLLLVTGV